MVGLFGLDPLAEILLIAAPTACVWCTDRRAKPWQCPKCRYDLRGLDGGVCPECGTQIIRDELVKGERLKAMARG